MDETAVEVLVAKLDFIAYFGYLLAANSFHICLENAIDLHLQIKWSSS